MLLPQLTIILKHPHHHLTPHPDALPQVLLPELHRLVYDLRPPVTAEFGKQALQRLAKLCSWGDPLTQQGFRWCMHRCTQVLLRQMSDWCAPGWPRGLLVLGLDVWWPGCLMISFRHHLLHAPPSVCSHTTAMLAAEQSCMMAQRS